MAGYTRNDTLNNIADGNVISAADLDGEFDALDAAFDEATGHVHDGTANNGAPITKVGPAQDLVVSTGAVTPKTDNAVDLGTSSFEFKDLYIDGTANIDSLVADTADINAGTIDGVTLGTNSAVTQAQIDNININGNAIITTDTNGNLALTPNGTGEVDISKVDIDSGTIDGTTIGGASAAAGTFTNLTASGTVNFTGATVSNGGTFTTIDINGGSIDAVTIGTNSAVTDLRVDNLQLNGNTISSTDTNGNIAITPNGTGEVDISKVDIDSGEIDGTTIGANSAAAGTFTTATATTGNITTVNATTVDTTNIEVTNIKAKDGTSAGSIADSTGVVTLASSVLTTTDINGGTIDGTAIGDSTPAAGTFTSAVIRNTSTDILSDVTIGSIVFDTLDTQRSGTDVGSIAVVSEAAFNGTTNDKTELVFKTFDGTNLSTALTLNGSGTAEFVAGSASTPAITTTGDTNTGIFFPAADTIAFAEGGAEAMRINSSGNVGIGASAPAAKLEISSTNGGVTDPLLANTRLRFTDADPTKANNQVTGGIEWYTADTDDAGVYAYISSATNSVGAGYVTFATGSSSTIAERMRIDPSGNVGIGTSSPSQQLHIANADDAIVLIESTGSDATDDANIQLKTTNGTFTIQNDRSIGTSGALTFAGNTADNIVIDHASGNVLIGTTTAASTQGANLQVITAAAIRRNIAGSGGGALRFEKSRSATDGGYTIVQNDDTLGEVQFYGADGVDYAIAASIRAIVNGTHGSNDMPGALLFGTTADGSATSTERMRITSAGEVLVGGTTAIASSGALTVQKTDSGSLLYLYRNDTSIVSGNTIGLIGFYGNDTTSNTPTRLAYISADASGDHAAGDNPTDIVFGTTPDGTETVAEAGRITQSGAYVLKGGTTTAAAGVGIVFPSTQVASADVNCLDDYEEGDWTPTYVPQTGAFTSITYDAITSGKYTKIGRMVTVSGRIRTDAITVGTASGNVYIGGLPFTVGNAQGFYNGLSIGDASAFGGDTPLSGYAAINGTTAVLMYRTSVNGAGIVLDVTDLGTGSNANAILFSMTYFTA